uniref:Uncharacterized protein n=1 Tax=Physcomitrium patens TaxID=3218 RepID=A0A2K1KI63_PHYPA|nr:hypothetical protein PHYPA_007140 [Physcomitrium patens]
MFPTPISVPYVPNPHLRSLCSQPPSPFPMFPTPISVPYVPNPHLRSLCSQPPSPFPMFPTPISVPYVPNPHLRSLCSQPPSPFPMFPTPISVPYVPNPHLRSLCSQPPSPFPPFVPFPFQPQPRQLDELQTLNLSNNLTRIDAEVARLPMLSKLNVSNNQLNRVITPLFMNNNSLVLLDLSSY